jgi:hypothetical protein
VRVFWTASGFAEVVSESVVVELDGNTGAVYCRHMSRPVSMVCKGMTVEVVRCGGVWLILGGVRVEDEENGKMP